MAEYKNFSTSDMLAARLKQLSAARPNRASIIKPLPKDDKISHMLGHQPLSKQSSTPAPTLEQMRQEEMEREKSTLLGLEASNYQLIQLAAANWETLFAAPTYYSDGVIDSENVDVNFEDRVADDLHVYSTHAPFDTPRGKYHVSTYVYPDGSRSVRERGKNRGVFTDIVNKYNPDGTVHASDTTYNGFHPGDVGYEQLKAIYETPKENSVGENPNRVQQPAPVQTPAPESEPFWKRLTKRILGEENAARIGIRKQGGYLRLQKQGGKLVEVWTPFN